MKNKSRSVGLRIRRLVLGRIAGSSRLRPREHPGAGPTGRRTELDRLSAGAYPEGRFGEHAACAWARDVGEGRI
jgi:hypothetical protein